MEGVIERSLQSLQARCIATLCIHFGLLLLILAVIWILPIFYHRLEDGKIKSPRVRVILRILFAGSRKIKGKYKKQKEILMQVVLTLLFSALLAVLILPQFKQLSMIQRDISEGAYGTYEGAYAVAYHYSREFYLSDLWLDERVVTLTDTNEQVWADMSGTWEGITSISGEFYGTVVYGQHSKWVIYVNGLVDAE